MPRKPPIGKSLAEVNPELAKQWHSFKNGTLTPRHFFAGSHSKVWWTCPKDKNHIWQATIGSRHEQSVGCPICAGQKTIRSNSLGALNPNLAKEWHPIKNGELTPFQVRKGSKQKVWWKCPKGPDHEWLARIDSRSKGAGCSVCNGKTIVPSISLGTINPELAEQWHSTMNGDVTPFQVSPGSHKKYWWKCNVGDDHIWEASVKHRSNGKGCPVCYGRKVTPSISLVVKNPELANEWHPSKNGELLPSDVTVKSNKKVWWKCPKGPDHEWKSAVYSRTTGRGCPICANQLVVESNCLSVTNPKLASEWHPTKNGKLTPYDVTAGSSRVHVWWKCDKGEDHEWKAPVYGRTNGEGCPFCTLTPQSRQELTISFELMRFFEINPKGFKTRVDGKLWSIDIFISELNLGVEFDGSYWHKDKKALDKLKTEKLQEEGFTIMRIREFPLKQITPIDVVSEVPFNAKKVTNDVLKHILRAYTLEKKKVDAIKGYLKKRSLQNEEGLNQYIDHILEEKASRKSKKN